MADSRVFNIEMQNDVSGDLVKRARYYHSALDRDYLQRGQPYTALPDTFVIFVCSKDPFDRGLSQYSLQEYCVEIGNPVDTGRYTLYLNASYKHAFSRDAILEFLDYIREPALVVPSTSLVRCVHDEVHIAKLEEYVRSDFMSLDEKLQKERDEGREEGREEAVRDLARKPKRERNRSEENVRL